MTRTERAHTGWKRIAGAVFTAIGAGALLAAVGTAWAGLSSVVTGTAIERADLHAWLGLAVLRMAQALALGQPTLSPGICNVLLSFLAVAILDFGVVLMQRQTAAHSGTASHLPPPSQGGQ